MNKDVIDEQIKQLGIHELRTLAREMGVKSPTTKKRDELIAAIRAIKSKEVEPQFNNKFGRPVKKHSEQRDLILKLLASGDEELEDKIRKNQDQDFGEIVFEQNITDPNIIITYKTIIVEGVLRKTKKGTYYFLNYQKLSEKTYIVVEDSFITKHNLLIGDYIYGEAYYENKDGLAYLKMISQINGVLYDENIVKKDNTLIVPNKVLEAPDFKMGQSKAVAVSDINQAIEYIKPRAEKFYEQGIKCLVVGLEISIETLLKIERINGLFPIISTYEDMATFSKEKLIDAQNHALSLFNHDKNVVVFILNTLQIFDTLNVACKGNEEEIGYLIRKTIAQCKATEISSISVYTLYNSDKQESYSKEIKTILKIIQN